MSKMYTIENLKNIILISDMSEEEIQELLDYLNEIQTNQMN